LRAPKITDKWIDCKENTKEILWVSPEHCVLLCGYDANEIYYNDPHTGKQEHCDKTLFLKRWRQLGQQAVSYSI